MCYKISERISNKNNQDKYVEILGCVKISGSRNPFSAKSVILKPFRQHPLAIRHNYPLITMGPEQKSENPFDLPLHHISSGQSHQT